MRYLALILIASIGLSSCAACQKPKTLDQVKAKLICVEYANGMAWAQIRERLGAADVAPLPEPGTNLQSNARVYRNKLRPVYVVGNHDIDLVRWFKDKGETFGRKWRHFAMAEGRKRVLYEHGFQADFANNQASWSGVIGKETTKIVGMMEYIDPNIDVELGSLWDAIVRVFNKYNVFSPNGDPQGFNAHELMRYYLDLMVKYNAGDTLDHYGGNDIDLVVAVIGHTHNARLVRATRNGNVLYLMDCGSWVNGGHEFGVLSGKDMAICRWG